VQELNGLGRRKEGTRKLSGLSALGIQHEEVDGVITSTKVCIELARRRHLALWIGARI